MPPLARVAHAIAIEGQGAHARRYFLARRSHLVEQTALLSGHLLKLQKTVKFKAEAEFKVRTLVSLLRVHREETQSGEDDYTLTPAPAPAPAVALKLPSHASLALSLRAAYLLKNTWGQWRRRHHCRIRERAQQHQALKSCFYSWTAMVSARTCSSTV
jgi:hypothetical protein